MRDDYKGSPPLVARHAAVRRLREAHPDEFAGYLREERTARGLPAELSTPARLAALERENARLRARVEELTA